jgi:hypothetical protein
VTDVFDKIYASLQTNPSNSKNRFLILARHYIDYAWTDEQVLQVVSWLQGDDPNLKDQPLSDDDLRWDIVKLAYTSSELTTDEKNTIFGEVEITDVSPRAKATKVVCDATIADEDVF